MNIKKIISICCLILVSACSAGGPGNVHVVVKPVWGSAFCGNASPAGLQLIASSVELKAWLHGRTEPVPEITVGLKDNYLLVVNMGQQSSGGYGLSLLKEQAEITGRHLLISVRWQTPKPGMMQAQVITSPCLLVSVPRQDNYNAIVIFDQNIKKRFTFKIKASQ